MLKLAAGLGELSEGAIATSARHAFIDSGRKAKTRAGKLINARGGYPKAGKGGDVRRGLSWRMSGELQGRLTSVNKWFSLAPWSRDKDPQGDYTRRGNRRVIVRGHVHDMDLFSIGDKKAFVRSGASGNVHVFGRSGESRYPLYSISAMNPSHLLHHHVVHDPLVERFDAEMKERFWRKYGQRVSKIKGKYGL